MLYHAEWPTRVRELRIQRNHARGCQAAFRLGDNHAYVRLTQNVSPSGIRVISRELGIVWAKRFVEQQNIVQIAIFRKAHSFIHNRSSS